MRLLFQPRFAALLCAFAALCGVVAVVVHVEDPEVCSHEDGPQHHHNPAACAVCQFVTLTNAFADPSPLFSGAPLKEESSTWAPAFREWAPRKWSLSSPRGPPVV